MEEECVCGKVFILSDALDACSPSAQPLAVAVECSICFLQMLSSIQSSFVSLLVTQDIMEMIYLSLLLVQNFHVVIVFLLLVKIELAIMMDRIGILWIFPGSQKEYRSSCSCIVCFGSAGVLV